MQFLTTLLSALALAASTTASPISDPKRSELVVVSPTITSPHAGDSWPVGSNQNVTWDTSNIPPDGKNNTGTIVLGYDDGSGSENLDFENPLATGFLLMAGSQQVKVPYVQYRSTYFVVLFGDSGNKSPEFTIFRLRS
ncbi:hypothetical protein BJV78DRAFT_778497 [Lactifluus subvellereus]|nr:hypothetical protein BJV78DRAFT_778497 [Lactifluus subvellereus]